MPAIRSHHWPSSLSCSPPERPTERLALSRLLSKFATQPLETGILVNCVAPVMAETELMQQMTAEHIAASKAKIPMKRFLQVPEIAATVAFAASDDCSFTTGFTFDLSGGRADY
jgi:NAD(P)-dependent dehydrogenase (short-subunit alcohol dehydrogenase family)